MAITYGWRIPDFPVDGSSAAEFRAQIFNYLDVLHGHFETAWAGDHFFPWMGSMDQRTDTIEALSTLAFVAGKYPRMKIGTIVLSQGYRSPAVLAKMATNLQWLTGGRFILGIGAGWKENEYHAYGLDYPSTGTRIAQLEEALQVIQKMWSEDAPSFHGKYYSIQDAYCQPRPDPLPPLLIGGSGRVKMLRLVAQYADMLNFNNCSLEEYRDLLGVLAEHCRVVGRDPVEIRRTYSAECVAIADTRAEVDRILVESPFRDGDKLAGTPAESRAKIRAFADLGVEHFILRFPDFPRTEMAEKFIKEILPS